MPSHRFRQFMSPANGHKRYGTRATRLQSKLGRAIRLERLERLLERDKRHDTDRRTQRSA